MEEEVIGKQSNEMLQVMLRDKVYFFDKNKLQGEENQKYSFFSAALKPSWHCCDNDLYVTQSQDMISDEVMEAISFALMTSYNINIEILFDVYICANYFGMEEIQELCQDLIMNSMSTVAYDDVSILYKWAEIINDNILQTFLFGYMEINFCKLCKSKQFLINCPSELFHKCIFELPWDENDIFNLTKRWTALTEENNQRELYQKIRWGLVSKKNIFKQIKELGLKDTSDLDKEQLIELFQILKARITYKQENVKLVYKESFEERRPVLIKVLTPGGLFTYKLGLGAEPGLDVKLVNPSLKVNKEASYLYSKHWGKLCRISESKHGKNCEFSVFDIKSKNSTWVKKSPSPLFYHHMPIMLEENGILYVLGCGVTGVCEKFDYRWGTWSPLAPMPFTGNRVTLSATIINGIIYVCGPYLVWYLPKVNSWIHDESHLYFRMPRILCSVKDQFFIIHKGDTSGGRLPLIPPGFCPGVIPRCAAWTQARVFEHNGTKYRILWGLTFPLTSSWLPPYDNCSHKSWTKNKCTCPYQKRIDQYCVEDCFFFL